MSELTAREEVEALADSISGCISNVSDLPEWMRAPALGRDTRPILLLVSQAVIDSDWLATRLAAAEARAEAAARQVAAVREALSRTEGSGAWVIRGAIDAALDTAADPDTPTPDRWARG